MMPDRKKVIREIEDALSDDISKSGYIYGLSLVGLKNKALTDVLSLLKEQPEIVRCKDCKHRPKEPNFKTYESGFDIEFPEGSKCPCQCSSDEYYSWYPEDDWFCADGERREDE